jgi:hypothetical protein
MLAAVLIFTSLMFNSCEKKENTDDDLPVVPIPPPQLNIFIEWSTDPERFGDLYEQWSGKANIELQLGFDSEDITNNTIFPLTGTGSGTQYDCNVDIETPYYIENLSTSSFGVWVSGGYYYNDPKNSYFTFTLSTDEANFSYDVLRMDEGHEVRFPTDRDELEFVLGAIIFDLQQSYDYVYASYDTTILKTSFHVIAAFEDK